MSFLIFHIIYGLCWSVALLPMKILYLLSDMMFIITYFIFPYRKKIVKENLRNSFPEKTEAEIKDISKKFYRHFNDILFETLKLIHLSPQQLASMITLKNPEVLEDLYNQNKSVIAVIGHYNNWEWLPGIQRSIPHHPIAIYKPLNNKYVNDFVIKLRSRFGTELISMRETLRKMLEYSKIKRLTITAFITDQSPVWEEVQYWTPFLNQMTPHYLGIEKLAKKTDQAVVFFHVRKTARGKYEVNVIKLFDQPANTSQYEITKSHLAVLEKIINDQPEFWLWTHRRWKLTPRRLEELEQQNSGNN